MSESLRAEERDVLGEDGSVRQTRYGPGRQPWDLLVEVGWGPAFAAGNVLKYLRRVKHGDADLEKARWYYDRLREFTTSENTYVRLPAIEAEIQLVRLLTSDEFRRLLGLT